MMERHLLYFIRAEGTDLFKIGITSASIESRISQLRTGCPYPLSVYAYVDYATRAEAEAVEKRLHAALSSWNSNGEWFRIGERVAYNTFWRVKLDHDCAVAAEVAYAATGMGVWFIVEGAKGGPLWHADFEHIPDDMGAGFAEFRFARTFERHGIRNPSAAVGELVQDWYLFAPRAKAERMKLRYCPTIYPSTIDHDVNKYAWLMLDRLKRLDSPNPTETP